MCSVSNCICRCSAHFQASYADHMSHTDINHRLPVQRCLLGGSPVSGKWWCGGGGGGAGAAGYRHAGDLRLGGRQTELCYKLRQHRQPHPQRVFPIGLRADKTHHTVTPLSINDAGRELPRERPVFEAEAETQLGLEASGRVAMGTSPAKAYIASTCLTASTPLLACSCSAM